VQQLLGLECSRAQQHRIETALAQEGRCPSKVDTTLEPERPIWRTFEQ
jgi:hypothetical protein